MKIIMSETTNTLGEINVRLDIAERIIIFETVIETIQNETHREKGKYKMHRTSVSCEPTSSSLI